MMIQQEGECVECGIILDMSLMTVVKYDDDYGCNCPICYIGKMSEKVSVVN